jgi:hypothetical protein
MTAALIKQFEEVLKDVGSLSQEKLQKLVQDTLVVFQDLQKRIISANAEEKERAFEEALELKHALESYSATLAGSVGMNADQLARFSENPSNFSQKEWENMGEARRELGSFQEGLRDSLKVGGVKAPAKKAKKGTTRSDWISG